MKNTFLNALAWFIFILCMIAGIGSLIVMFGTVGVFVVAAVIIICVIFGWAITRVIDSL